MGEVLAYVLTVWSQFLLDSKGIDYLVKPTYFGVSLMALFGFDLLVRVKMDDMYPRISAFFKGMYKCVQGAFFIYVPVMMILDRYLFRSWEVQREGRDMEILVTCMLLWVLTFGVAMGD